MQSKLRILKGACRGSFDKDWGARKKSGARMPHRSFMCRLSAYCIKGMSNETPMPHGQNIVSPAVARPGRSSPSVQTRFRGSQVHLLLERTFPLFWLQGMASGIANQGQKLEKDLIFVIWRSIPPRGAGGLRAKSCSCWGEGLAIRRKEKA